MKWMKKKIQSPNQSVYTVSMESHNDTTPDGGRKVRERVRESQCVMRPTSPCNQCASYYIFLWWLNVQQHTEPRSNFTIQYFWLALRFSNSLPAGKMGIVVTYQMALDSTTRKYYTIIIKRMLLFLALILPHPISYVCICVHYIVVYIPINFGYGSMHRLSITFISIHFQ